jgi:hypothetical protein
MSCCSPTMCTYVIKMAQFLTVESGSEKQKFGSKPTSRLPFIINDFYLPSQEVISPKPNVLRHFLLRPNPVNCIWFLCISLNSFLWR